MTSPFLRRLVKDAAIGVTGRKSEKRLAKATGSRLTPASGALKGAKGDMVRKAAKASYLVEAKSTTGKTLALENDWLIKIAMEAGGSGKVPMLVVSFVNSDGKPRTPRNAEWALLPLWALQELIEEAEKGSPEE